MPCSRLLPRFNRVTRSPTQTTPVQAEHIGDNGLLFEHVQPLDRVDLTVKAAAKSHITARSGSTVGSAEGFAVGTVDG